MEPVMDCLLPQYGYSILILFHFFGSAIYNYGVEPLFDALVVLAPSPAPRPADKNDGSEIEIEFG